VSNQLGRKPLSPPMEALIYVRIYVMLGLLWLTERMLGAVKTIQRVTRADGVECISVLVASGWALTLALNRDFLGLSNYAYPIEQMVGATRLTSLFLFLAILQGTSLFLTRDDRDERNAPVGPASTQRKANQKAVYLLRTCGFMASAGIWLFFGVVVNISMFVTSAHTLNPYTGLYLYLVSASTVFACEEAVNYSAAQKQRHDQIEEQKAKTVAAT